MSTCLFKPKVPDNMPEGFFYRVYRAYDRYGRADLVVGLYRRRKYWFSKKYDAIEVSDAKYYSDPQRIKQQIESNMRHLLNEARKELHNERYIYGRHP